MKKRMNELNEWRREGMNEGIKGQRKEGRKIKSIDINNFVVTQMFLFSWFTV